MLNVSRKIIEMQYKQCRNVLFHTGSPDLGVLGECQLGYSQINTGMCIILKISSILSYHIISYRYLTIMSYRINY